MWIELYCIQEIIISHLQLLYIWNLYIWSARVTSILCLFGLNCCNFLHKKSFWKAFWLWLFWLQRWCFLLFRFCLGRLVISNSFDHIAIAPAIIPAYPSHTGLHVHQTTPTVNFTHNVYLLWIVHMYFSVPRFPAGCFKSLILLPVSFSPRKRIPLWLPITEWCNLPHINDSSSVLCPWYARKWVVENGSLMSNFGGLAGNWMIVAGLPALEVWINLSRLFVVWKYWKVRNCSLLYNSYGSMEREKRVSMHDIPNYLVHVYAR